MDAPPPSYEDVTRGGASAYTTSDASSTRQPSAPPTAEEFSHGQHPSRQEPYRQPPYGQPSSSLSHGPASSIGHGGPQHAPRAGGTHPHYTYTTVQAGPRYQYSPAQGVSPISAGYQTTPLTKSARMKHTGGSAGQKRPSARTGIIITGSMKRAARRQRIRTGIIIVTCLALIVIILIAAIVIAATL